LQGWAPVGVGQPDGQPQSVRALGTRRPPPRGRATGPSLVAEVRGGYPDVTEEQLAAIDQPTLFVGARDSAFDYAETTEAVAAAISSATTSWLGLQRCAERPPL